MVDPPEVLDFFLDPGSYPDSGPEPFEVHETHISRVVLAGPWAYKMKKPVDLGFLDYSTLEARRRFCMEEVRLNRRLAPDVYDGVLAIRERGGKLELAREEESTPGEVVEWVVRMRRVPSCATLASLVERGAAETRHVDALAGLLLPFFRDAPRAAPDAPWGRPETLRKTLEGNFEHLRGVVGKVVSQERFTALRSSQLTFLTLREDLFEARRRAGFIREGHGDLRAEHVAYIPGPAVLDAIEFSEELRWVDVGSDLAFLKMDLEQLGSPALGSRLIDLYVDGSGDEGLAGLLDFHVSYRATVRGMVDGIKLGQAATPPDERAALLSRSRRLIGLAHYHAVRSRRPLLVLVGGLSGTGKSTLARGLGERLGAVVFRSDEFRKLMAGLPPTARPQGDLGRSLYSPETTRRTYEAMAGFVRPFLLEGATVILDATFPRRDLRELARREAVEAGADCVHLELAAPRDVAATRMQERAAQGADASDATPAIQAEQAAAYEPCAPGEALPIDASREEEAVIAQALSALRAARAP